MHVKKEKKKEKQKKACLVCRGRRLGVLADLVIALST